MQKLKVNIGTILLTAIMMIAGTLMILMIATTMIPITTTIAPTMITAKLCTFQFQDQREIKVKEDIEELKETKVQREIRDQKDAQDQLDQKAQ